MNGHRVVAKALSIADAMARPATESWWKRTTCLRLEDLGVRSCLVLAPHPDDETIGCGATIAGLVDLGADVRVAVASDGRYGGFGVEPQALARVRADELMEATARLGVGAGQISAWGLEDGSLHRQGDRLRQLIRRSIEESAPDTVMVTCRADPHPDHAALAVAVAEVLHGAGTQLLEYPIWSRRWPGRAFLSVPGAGYLVSRSHSGVRVATGALVERKADALRAYRSQYADGPADRFNAAGGFIDDAFAAMFLSDEEYFIRSVP